MSENTDLNTKNSKDNNGKTPIDFMPIDPIYTFDNVVLEPKVKEEILSALSFLEFKDKIFNEWNFSKVIKQPTNLCMNFYGETGTGKTMVANAIASHFNQKLIKVNYATIESKYVGDTAKNLINLFKMSKHYNAILLFDEADALLSKRVTSMNNATDVSVNQTRSVLLTLLDEFEGIAIFTTNFIKNYDSAFLRRIPYHIKFDLPNEKVRADIFNHYLTDTIPHNINIQDLAFKSFGVSGSDISNAIVIAVTKTARENQNELSQLTLEEAIANILISKLENGTLR